MENKGISIIVGTNENYIIGYDLEQKKNGELKFNRTFAERAHTQSVRKVSVSKRFLASGGADEVIRIYNLKKKVEVGCIEKHTGNITGLEFHGKTHFFSSSEDGCICIYKADSWKCEKTLSAHPGGVTSISVHPSGKLALSVGKDKKLLTWNLIKGKKAYTTNLKAVGDIVLWNPSGEQFIVTKGSCLDIYEVSSGNVKFSVDFRQTIQAVVFLTDDIVAVGGEGKNICLYDITNLMELTQWPAHTMRIKSLQKIPTPSLDELWLVSASTDGVIKIWGIELLSVTGEPKLLGTVNTTCRIICMDVHVTRQNVHIKQERNAVDRVKEEVETLDDEDLKDLDDELVEEEEDEQDIDEEEEVEGEEEEDDSDDFDVFMDDSDDDSDVEIKEEPEESEEEAVLTKPVKKSKNDTKMGVKNGKTAKSGKEIKSVPAIKEKNAGKKMENGSGKMKNKQKRKHDSHPEATVDKPTKSKKKSKKMKLK